MKKLFFLLALVIAAGFTACEDPNDPPAGENACTISFNANEGAGSMPAQQIPENTSANLTANTFTRTGYTFAGWAVSSDGTAAYTDGQSYTAAAGANTVDLYAVWTANTYTITFDANGGSGGPASNATATYGQVLPALNPLDKPIKGTDFFTGYYDAQTGGTLYYDNNLAAEDTTWDKTADTTLYAQWSVIPVATISFNVNGGSGGQTTPVSGTYGQPMPALTAQAPVNEDNSDSGYVKYYFDGYWDAQTGGKQYYNADLTSAANWDKIENTELFARWLTAAQKYNITLGADDFVAYFVEPPPVIDGFGNDEVWAKAKWQDIKYAWMYNNQMCLPTGVTAVNADGTVPKTPDFSGRFKIVWTAERLYILAEIIDDIIYCPATNPLVSPEKNDCLELFIDEDASGGTRNTGGNNFFTYHMNFDGINVADYIATSGQNVLRNLHLNYKIDKNDSTHTYTWETEMRVYDKSYPLATTPDNEPVTLTEGKVMGFVAAYCDNDNNAHSSNTTQIGNRDHFFGSMYVTGTTDDARNVAYQNSTQYAKLHLVK
jgi:uncharacterized repeat protein (TIGR02543 family)